MTMYIATRMLSDKILCGIEVCILQEKYATEGFQQIQWDKEMAESWCTTATIFSSDSSNIVQYMEVNLFRPVDCRVHH